MPIDTVYLLLMVMAIFKGFTKGLILGIFSFIGFFIGLAAALKLSTMVASYLEDSTGATAKWMPVISFLIVFIVVVWLVNLGAGLLRKSMSLVSLGWIDRLGGVLLYIIIYSLLFSILLFFAEKMNLVGAGTTQASKVYPWISSWGPKIFDNLGTILPFFKNMFRELQQFFENLGDKMAWIQMPGKYYF